MLMLRGIEGMTVRGIDNANGRESPGDARAWARGNKRKGNEWRVCIASKRRRCAYGLEGGSVDVNVNDLLDNVINERVEVSLHIQHLSLHSGPNLGQKNRTKTKFLA